VTSTLWPWAALVLLGAYHGMNPGMGWLFAVARGMQEKNRGAVLGSLLPIAIGHEASIVMVVVAVSLTEQVVPPFFMRLLAALVLSLASHVFAAEPPPADKSFNQGLQAFKRGNFEDAIAA